MPASITPTGIAHIITKNTYKNHVSHNYTPQTHREPSPLITQYTP